MAVLSHAFTIAMKEWEWVNDNPCMRVSKLKEARGRTRFLSKEEIHDLLEACKNSKNPYMYIIVVLALSTGARKNEIISLKWKHVHLNREVIVLDKTKNGDVRVLPLQGHALDLIERLHEDKDSCNLLFPRPYGTEPTNIRSYWIKAVQDAGLEDFRFHDLRHTAASYLAMDGASITDIAEVLGHKTLEMAKRYSHLSEAHTKKVVSSMNDKMFYSQIIQNSD
jgi:integrase